MFELSSIFSKIMIIVESQLSSVCSLELWCIITKCLVRFREALCSLAIPSYVYTCALCISLGMLAENRACCQVV
jgi:hypothetical protein